MKDIKTLENILKEGKHKIKKLKCKIISKELKVLYVELKKKNHYICNEN